jgi:hypothetical protein
MLPLLRKGASAETVNAVAYAIRYHSEWFWREPAKLTGAAD